MALRLSCVGFFVFLLAACGGGPEPRPEPKAPVPPAWTVDGEHRDFPPTAFLVSLGVGQNETECLEAAKAEIAQQIKVRVQGRIETAMRSSYDFTKPGSAVTESTQTSSMDTLSSYLQELKGLEPPKRWNDNRTFYVLAALNRERFAQILKVEIDQLKAESVQLATEGERMADQGDYGLAFINWVRSYNNESQVVSLREALRVVKTGAAGEVDLAGLMEARSRIDRFLSALSIRKLAGDRQFAGFGQPLPVDPTIEVTLDGRPVPGFPFKFRFEPGTGRLEDRTLRTDAQGRAACEVYVVEKTGARENAVVAGLDFQALDAEHAALAEGFLGDRGKATFVYYLPTQSFTKIAIRLNERVTEDEHNRSYRAGTRATAVLADFLRQEGFTLLDLSGAPTNGTREWLLAQAKQDPAYYYFDVTGDVSADCTGAQAMPSYGGGTTQMIAVAANVRITVYNATADAVVDEFTGQSMGAGRPGANLRGAGPSLEQAVQNLYAHPEGWLTVCQALGLRLHEVFATEQEMYDIRTRLSPRRRR